MARIAAVRSVVAPALRVPVARHARGLSGSVGSIEWFGGVLLVGGAIAAFTAPVLDLTGLAPRLSSFSDWRIHWMGLASCGVGFCLTVAAQFEMGSSWRIGVDPGEKIALRTHGLFGLVRNPVYSGVLLALLGLFLLVPNFVSALALLACFAGIELHVQKVEEPHLMRIHGKGV